MTLGSPAAGNRRRAILFLLPAVAAFVVAAAVIASLNRPSSGPAPRPSFAGDASWDVTSLGDFEIKAVDTSGPRILLRAATRGTRNDTVKFLGVRRRDEARLAEGTVVSVDVDWNRQSNGSGLSAGLVLAPAVTTGNPLETPAFLHVEYIGVPPGRNARMVIAVADAGRSRILHAEGWPDVRREGRPVGLQRLQVVVGKDRSFRVLENEVEVYASAPGVLPFDRAHLYLQMSSRSNYPPREIFFSNAIVTSVR